MYQKKAKWETFGNKGKKMSENKFINRLKGKQTAKSVLEIKNESAKTSFANMPQGTSNAIDVFSDHRGNATAVLNGTTNWKVSNSELLLADAVSGDGQDFTSTYSVSGSGLWVNASYTFPSTGDPRHPVAMVFNPSTKWVLKVCGDNLIVDGGSTVDFTMLVKIGTASVYSKNFTIRESAGQFSKEFIIDFGEANSDVIKAGGLSTLTVQLLCGTANASARIYNGMTVLTCLQRKVDASAVSNSSANVEDVLDGNIIPSDYFSNPAFIDQIEDGDTAVAIFARDGDDVNLDHWEQPIPDRTGNAGKFLQTPDGDKMSWEDVEISDVTGLQTELNGLQGQITTNKNTMDLHIGNTNNPHNVTKAQVGLGNVDNTSDLNKPISTATQTALDLKADKSTTYTKTETDTLLSAKQDTISDLSTIRSNAQAGKAASDTIATYGDIVTHDVAEFATAAQGAKADTALQAGDNVSELVNDAGYLTQHQSLSDLGITATASEINVLDGITATTAELNYTDGVTSNIQSQLDGKQATISDLSTIRSGAAAGATAVQPGDLATVATTGDYDDLLNKPTIPTVNDATLTIQKNGTNVATFTANASSAVTANISVPTDTNDLTNGAGYITGITSGDVTTALGYTPANNTDVVHKTGTETITGAKTFENTDSVSASLTALTLKGDNLHKGTNPSSNHFNSIEFTDDSDVNIAKFSAIQTNDGWTGFLAGAGSDPTAPQNNLLMIANGTSKLLLIPATSSHASCAVRRDFFNNNAVKHTPSTAVGSSTQPIYVASDGTATACSLATVASTGAYSDLSGTPTIPTVGNGTITITQGGISKGTFTTNQGGDTTIALDAGGGGIGNIDNITITANADDEIQAVAVIDQNTGIAKTWTGTMAEYDVIVTKDPETEYIITDDIGGSATEIGEITEALNNKVDKGHQVIEFQAPTAQNNYTWYRLYADGWVEQGGRVQLNGTISATNKRVTFPVVMATSKYIASVDNNANVGAVAYVGWESTTGMSVGLSSGSSTGQTTWEVKGMAA